MANNFGASWNLGTTFGKLFPQNFSEGKKRPKFGAISDNFGFRSRISLERIKTSTIGKRRYQLVYNATHVRRQKFGEYDTIRYDTLFALKN